MRWYLVVSLCVALSHSATGTLSKDDKKKPGSKDQQVEGLSVLMLMDGKTCHILM